MSNIESFLGGGGGGGGPTIAELLAKLPAMDVQIANDLSIDDLSELNALFGSAAAMIAVAKDAALVNLIIDSPSALPQMLASTTAMNAVAASTTAMNAVIASTTAMNAVAASTTAMNAVAASTTAMDAIYASTLTVKINYASGAIWGAGTTVFTGSGLLVRVTSFGRPSGWAEGSATTAQQRIIPDGLVLPMAARSENPHNHTALSAVPRILPQKFYADLAFNGFDPAEVAYLPL